MKEFPNEDVLQLMKIVMSLRNSAVPNEMPQKGAFHQVLHCLLYYGTPFRCFQYTKG